MTLLNHVLITLTTTVAMEGVAWLMHRYLMHGPLWCLHRSHHEPRQGFWERNDVFGIFFSGLSIMLIYLGIHAQPALLGVGIGLTLYGCIYFLLHDVLVHRRVRLPLSPKRGYLRRIYQAHHLHHATRGRDGAVSFGFAYAPSPERLKRLMARKQPKLTLPSEEPSVLG